MQKNDEYHAKSSHRDFREDAREYNSLREKWWCVCYSENKNIEKKDRTILIYTQVELHWISIKMNLPCRACHIIT